MVWSTQLQFILESKGLSHFVEGTETVPHDLEGRIKQRREKRQCLVEIILNIDNRFVAAVMKKDDPNVVWEKLKTMHKRRSMANLLTLRRRILNMHMKEGETVRAYVSSIYEIENELEVSGDELSDDDKTFALLEGLPEQYGIIRAIIQNEMDMPFEDMVLRLESREDEMDRVNYGRSTLFESKKGSSFIATSNHDHGRHHHSGKKRFICDKPRHMVMACFLTGNQRIINKT